MNICHLIMNLITNISSYRRLHTRKRSINFSSTPELGAIQTYVLDMKINSRYSFKSMTSLDLHDLAPAQKRDGVFYAPHKNARHDQRVLYVDTEGKAACVVSYVT